MKPYRFVSIVSFFMSVFMLVLTLLRGNAHAGGVDESPSDLIQTLPAEVLSRVMSFLQRVDRLSLAKSSKLLRAIVLNHQNPNVEVDLSGADISDEDFSALFGENGLFSQTKKLNLNGANFNSKNLSLLPPTLTSLKMEYAALRDHEVIFIAHLTHLEELYLKKNHIGPKGIASAISKLTHLKRLDLEGNQIRDLGFEKLAGLAALECLNVEGNKISGIGLIKFASQPHPELKVLNISRNFVAGGEAAFSKLTSLTDLNLSATERFGKEGVSALQPLVNLESLNLASTELDNESVGELSKFKFPHLQFLDLQLNEIDDAGIASLSQLNLEKATQLKILILHGTELTLEGYQSSKEKLSHLGEGLNPPNGSPSENEP